MGKRVGSVRVLSGPIAVLGVMAIGLPVLLTGCPLQILSVVDGNSGILPKNHGVACGEAVCDLSAGAARGAGSGEIRGEVIVSHDNNNLYVTFAPADGFAVGVTHVDVLCTLPDRRGAPGQYQSTIDPGGLVVYPDHITHVFPLGAQSGSDGCELGTCASGISQTVFVRAHAESYTEDGGDEETAFGGVSNCDGALAHGYPSVYIGSAWFGVIEYAVACCGAPPGMGGGECRTQTIGGWGAPAHGENPGTIRDAVYGVCFEDGLTLGCDGGFTLRLSDAAAMEDFLPSGGKPGVLSGDEADPTGKSSAGVLAGQLAAIKMTLCADANFQDYADCAPGTLMDLCYVEDGSPYEGLTIGEIVDMADEVIGGCNTDDSPGDLADVLTNINENFVDGDMDLGYLVDCS